MKPTGFVFSIVIGCNLYTEVTIAQVIPDSTVGTRVTGNPNFTITDGSRPNNGPNLFHSFTQFSVPTGGSAWFDNPLGVVNIFSRITGGSISNIDGAIKANGNANLFLMNPAGIIFGPKASLNIGGSFVGTTATRIKFNDGSEFSATNPSSSSLLTISTPIGLQMGPSPGSITVQNTGHRMPHKRYFAPDRSKNPQGLKVSSGQTLALISGETFLEGGVLTAPSGHIELGNGQNGTVKFNPSVAGWGFDYSQLPILGNIAFSKQALVDASGVIGGSIHFQGKNISLVDGSVGLIVNQGSDASGSIGVNASESLTVGGSGIYGAINSLLETDTLGSGSGGNISIVAPKISIVEGAKVLTQSSINKGTGGNISIVSTDSILIKGFSSLDMSTNSVILATTVEGNGGNINITASKISIQDSASIAAGSVGGGQGGRLTINASDRIDVLGESPLRSSAVVTSAVNHGNAGHITINTSHLNLQQGGAVITTTLGSGKAGNIFINASNILVSGKGRLSDYQSRIGARAELLSPITRKILGATSALTGDSGTLDINSAQLRVTDDAFVGVDNQGTGQAGDFRLKTNILLLDRGGRITAETASGRITSTTGANLNLRVRDALMMRHGSSITTNAKGAGNGGNITIDSPIVLGLENSDIIANARQGRGGNIQIKTQGLISLAYRNTLTPRKDLTDDITASSEFSVNGTVQINSLGVDPHSGLMNLPENLSNSDYAMKQNCTTMKGNSFVMTARGGIPQSPREKMMFDRPWSDQGDRSALNSQISAVPLPINSPQTSVMEAHSLRRTADGSWELDAPRSLPQNRSATCAVASQR